MNPAVHQTVYPATNYMDHLLVLFVFCLISSYKLISKQVNESRMHLVLQKENQS